MRRGDLGGNGKAEAEMRPVAAAAVGAGKTLENTRLFRIRDAGPMVCGRYAQAGARLLSRGLWRALPLRGAACLLALPCAALLFPRGCRWAKAKASDSIL